MKGMIHKKGKQLNRAERRAKEEGINYFKELLKVTKHFFPKLFDWLKDVNDPRDKSYIDYEISMVLLLRILAATMSINSMRSLTEKFNNHFCIENIRFLFNDSTIEELPHYDTINDVLERLDPKELKVLQHKLIVRLIQMKCFSSYKVNKRWLVSIDGTKISTFRHKHCDQCLTKTYKRGKKDEYTLYFHYVLEAKLTVGDMVFSLGNEFIENAKEPINQKNNQDFTEKQKQDCELNAFYRLEKRLKREYPRLPICLLLDSLYANQNVFDICWANNWDYIIRCKEGSLPIVAQEFCNHSKRVETDTVIYEGKTTGLYSYVNGIDYASHRINVVEYGELIENEARKTTSMQIFTFITSPNLQITKKNQQKIVEAGRYRWKIENQGFNEQKNHGYNLTHPYSHNYRAMKNHYLLIQIAHIMRQLYEVGVKLLKEYKKSLATISDDILMAFRTKALLPSDKDEINCSYQIRLNVSAR